MTSNPIDWRARADALQLRNQAFINGRYADASSGAKFDCISPIDGRVLTKVAACDAADIEAAVQAARAVFEQGAWSQAAPKHRKRVLLKFAELIEANTDELALLETLDMGKPIRYSRAVDVPATVQCLCWYAEAIDKLYDEVAPTERNVLATITREPIGVVGAIVPWNFPLIMAAWKFAPALAAGNSIIIKPSEKSPLSVLRIAELATQAGLPNGVFNVVPGFGHTAGKALALHEDVDCIGFTGSTATGKLMLQYSGQSNMKRVWLECGGKSPNIVMADVADMESAAKSAAAAIFFNQGEMCSAGSRLLVHESIKDALLERVAFYATQYQVGDPLSERTKVGALVDGVQLQRVSDYVTEAQQQGASLRYGGKRLLEATGGYYYEPTVVDVKPDMTIAREEVFGPVLSALTFKDEAEAIHIANDVMYGLAGAVWTRDLNTAHRMSRALRAGMVYVNCYDDDDITVPFGGYKQSGSGRDKSLHAFDKYTELKTTWIRFGE